MNRMIHARAKKSEAAPKEKKAKKETVVQNSKTSPQQLGSVIKSARDIMRKDRGLSGDSDRLPQLTWMLFLKFIDDNERMREVEAELAGETFKPAIAETVSLAGLGRSGRRHDRRRSHSTSSTTTKPPCPTASRARDCSNISRTCAATTAR